MKLSVKQKRKWNSILIDTLSVLVSICEKQNYRYYLAYGTALGAIRHGGMIPWDDDIDIVMPRPDYERLRGFCQSHDIGHYQLFDPESKGDFYTAFMKFADMNTTLLESDKHKMAIGIYVDIFPLDGCPDDMDLFLKKSNKLRKLYANMFREVNENKGLLNGIRMLFKGKLLYFVRSIMIFINKDVCRSWSLKGIHKLIVEYKYDNSECVCSYLSPYIIKERMPRKVYGVGKKAKFEGRDYIVPEQVEEYLTTIYGNYMQLPPEEKRVSHHHCSYVDFGSNIED